MTLKFDLYEQYLEAHGKIAKIRGEFLNREREARLKYENLKKEYEELIKRSVEEGVDLTAELDKLDEDIKKASKDLARREAELKVTLSTKKEQIRRTDVVNAFRNEYTSQVRKKELPGIYERFELGRSLLLSSILDLYNLKFEYDEITDEVKKLAINAQQAGEVPHLNYVANPIFENTDFSGRPGIAGKVTDMPLEANEVIEKRELPDGVKYIGGLKEVCK
jgi:hypothetical protein